MRYSIRTVTPATDIPLPFELAEAKAHLRVDGDDEDALIEAQLRAAMDAVEAFTSQVLTPRTLELALGAFPCASVSIEIPRDPVTAVSAIAYTDTAGAPVDLDGAEWRWSESSSGLVLPAFGGSWPTAAAEAASVLVTFNAGYEEGLAPPSLIAAVKLTLGSLYMGREDAGLSPAAQALCRPYRRVAL